jgi:3-deoxy-D-manno-octulosonate 8-phosphate phosphatase (KDO 8-P phosphatase)
MARLSRRDYEARLRQVRLLIMDVDGVLTEGQIIYIGADSEGKVFHVRDGSAMYLARLIGLQTAVITGRESEAVAKRFSELPVGDLRQGALDKVAACREIQAARGLSADEIAFVGDDLIDIPIMEYVGLSIAVADAQPQVIEMADWTTERRGGHGAVREVVDDIVNARGLWDRVLENYRERQGPDPSQEGQAG